MTLSRRGVMAVLAAGALSPSLASCASGPDPIAAWRDPGAGETDVRRFALAHAILAPNPHNRQSWLVDLVGENEIVLSADLDRLLPETDPFDRQITIGCGAFLELLSLAAASRGFDARISPWPQGEPEPRLDARPVAHVRLVEGGTRDALFDHILARRTNRGAYEPRAPGGADLAAITQAAGLPAFAVDGGDLRQHVRDLAWAAFETEFSTPAAHMETVNLLRVGRAEIARHRDGIAIDGLVVEVARTFGLVNKATLADINNPQTRQGLEEWRPLALDAPAFVWIRTADNSRATQIAAGRGYARMNLEAAARGLAMHPWSQALQEYPEMAAQHARAQTLLSATNGETIQMLARIGYGPRSEPAPRRGLAEHLRA